jgi:hypothetical protein
VRDVLLHSRRSVVEILAEVGESLRREPVVKGPSITRSTEVAERYFPQFFPQMSDTFPNGLLKLFSEYGGLAVVLACKNVFR